MSEEVKPAAQDDRNWKPSFSPWLIAAAVVLAAFVEVLDTTIVAVALPYMAGNLSSTNEEATWVLTSYLVSNAIVLPASGWLALKFGRKRFLMTCMSIFITSSFLCGIAPTMGLLVFARVLQGIGGGALQPIAQAILLESFPKEKRGMAMAAFGFAVVTAPIIGPTLGGWLTDHYSWRWVFNINVPIGLFGLFMMGRYLEDPPWVKNGKPGTIDGIGFGLLTIWIAALQIVLDKGQTADWFSSPMIRWMTAISVVALITLIYRELNTENPIMDLRVFKDRNFWVGTTVISVVSAAMYGSLTTLPLFLQGLMGYTSESAGWAMSPRGIGSMAIMPVVGILLARMDGRWLTSIGIAGLAITSFLLSRITLDVTSSAISWPIVFQGSAVGMIFVSIMSLSMATLPNEKMGNATGIFNLMRNLGGSIGISISTAYTSRFAQMYQSQLTGHMTPMDPVYRQTLAATTAALTPHSGAPQAAQQAQALMYGVVQQQANYQAFMAIFAWSAIFVGVLVLTPFLMKRVSTRGPVSVH